jgi:ribose/xylose/arabinose/galactoside ABC-type transport system permease subunit
MTLPRTPATRTVNGRTLARRISLGMSHVYILVLLVVLSSLLVPGFLSILNILNLLRDFSFLGIVAVGMTFVILSGGIVDLSIGSIVGLSTVIMALSQHWGIYKGFMTTLSHVFPTPFIIMTVLLVGGGLGFVNGIVIAKLRVSGFVTTLGMMAFARGLAFAVSGGVTIFGVDAITHFLGRGMIGPLPLVALIWVVIVLAGLFVLRQTPFGWRLYAVGENRETAFLSGINPGNYTIAAYTISGALAAVAGICMTGRLDNGEPSLGQSWELYAIAAVVIGGTSFDGGRGGLGRTVIGVIIIELIQNVLGVLGVLPSPQMMIMGLVLIAAVVLQRTTQAALG